MVELCIFANEEEGDWGVRLDLSSGGGTEANRSGGGTAHSLWSSHPREWKRRRAREVPAAAPSQPRPPPDIGHIPSWLPSALLATVDVCPEYLSTRAVPFSNLPDPLAH